MADQGTPRREQSAGVETFQFRLWGRFSARRQSDGADVTPRGRKTRALLACLLLSDGRMSRERLAGLLWSERAQAQAHASLRQCLLELKDLAPILASDRQSVGLVVEATSTDIAAAEAAVARCDLEDILVAISTGSTLLEDLDGVDSAFDQWLRSLRAERGQALLDAALGCGRSALESGRPESAERIARRLQSIDPLDERAARLAMDAAHRLGKQDAVRRIHHELTGSLRAELNVGPSEETRALHDRLAGPGVRRVAAEARTGPRAEAPSGPDTQDRPVDYSPSESRSKSRIRRWVAAGLALLLVAGAIGFGLRVLDRIGTSSDAASLAVLPFRNLSAGDEYFAEGVAEEILSQLAREPQLRVVGRSSSWMFDDPGIDVRDVGRRLDVAYVLEGSVRRAGNRVQVDVALVSTSDGMRLWSQAFQGSLNDIFAIQRGIGVEVVGRLRRQLAHLAPVSGPLTTRGDVYNLYLTARGLVRTREPDKVETGVQLLRSAVGTDPNYAPAWAELGKAVLLQGQNWSNAPDRGERLAQEARRYIARALVLAPELAEAHHARSMIDANTASTRQSLERAVRLEPGNAEYWHALANARAGALDFEGALEASRRTTQIDPFWIRSAGFSTLAAGMGSRDEALAFDRRLARDHPEPFSREMALARIANHSGDWSTVLLHVSRAMRIVPLLSQPRTNPDPFFVMVRMGRLDELQRLIPVPPMVLALVSGRAPPVSEIERIMGGGTGFWMNSPGRTMVARLLLQRGRAADLVGLYDRAFDSPQSMAISHPHGRQSFIQDAPGIALALRQVGRNAESATILSLADRMIRSARARGRIPRAMQEAAARVWAVQGKRDQALSALERAIAMGWQYDEHGFVPRLADEPAYRSLRDEPRLRRLDARMQADIARERREAAALSI